MFTDINNLLVDLQNGIATITVNRPSVRNALNLETWSEIDLVLGRLTEDEGTRVIVFTGAGEEAFIAGADINVLKAGGILTPLGFRGQEILNKIENLTKPVIAAINGYALGGGCELSMACDIRIASEKAKLGLPEVNLGIIPGAGGTQRMARLVGLGKAKELILTGAVISATEAERIGLVNKVVPHQDLFKAVEEVATKIMSKGPIAVRLAKLAVNVSLSTDIASGQLVEKLASAALFGTNDQSEGMAAFLEKRKPRFEGR